MNNPTEKRFEAHIEASLIQQGYSTIPSNEYDKTLCLIPNEVIGFLKRTQPKDWAKLETHYGSDAETKILKRINIEIANRGTIDVLRTGIKDLNARFNLVYFEPKSGLNQEHLRLFKENQLSVVRQLFYSNKNKNSMDMVLFVNGIPIITMELKNKLTNQNIIHSQNQYKRDRNDQTEPILRDRKSTRLNSSHITISYAVFCLKKKKTKIQHETSDHSMWQEVIAINGSRAQMCTQLT